MTRQRTHQLPLFTYTHNDECRTAQKCIVAHHLEHSTLGVNRVLAVACALGTRPNTVCRHRQHCTATTVQKCNMQTSIHCSRSPNCVLLSNCLVIGQPGHDSSAERKILKVERIAHLDNNMRLTHKKSDESKEDSIFSGTATHAA